MICDFLASFTPREATEPNRARAGTDGSAPHPHRKATLAPAPVPALREGRRETRS